MPNLWSEYQDAVASNDAERAFVIATKLMDTGTGLELPVEAPPLPTLANWRAARPNIQVLQLAIVLRSTSPSLAYLSDYLLVYVDEGDGISVLLPRTERG